MSTKYGKQSFDILVSDHAAERWCERIEDVGMSLARQEIRSRFHDADPVAVPTEAGGRIDDDDIVYIYGPGPKWPYRYAVMTVYRYDPELNPWVDDE